MLFQQAGILLDHFNDCRSLISSYFQILTIINEILVFQYMHTCFPNGLLLSGHLRLPAKGSTLQIPTVFNPVKILAYHILGDE